MKIALRKTYLALLFTLLSISSSFAKDFVSPPDTTSNVVDRAAALVIIEEGRTLYNEGKVRDALVRFRQASVKDPYSWKANYWISQCHYSMNNYGLALKYANEAVALNNDEVDKDIYELLGRSYHRMGNLDSAIINYNIAIEKLPATRVKDLQLQLRVEQCMFAKAEMAGPNKSKRIAIATLNSGYNDYAPVLMPDGKSIYFASRRSDTKGGNMNPDDQEFFEDIYHAYWNETEGTWDSITNELGRLNSDGFDCLTFISRDGMHGLMTMNTEALPKNKTTRGSDIFALEMTTKGTWSSPKKIKNKTINTTFFDGAATMTEDGNTMYFASDRKGEKSSVDIYMVQKVGKAWGEAKPLPANINTIGYETTPFVTGDGRYLFFSSDGHQGMGGRDIYVSENLGGGVWGDPVNLGIMVNTVNNDSHFQYYPAMNKAVMSSFEVIGQKASMDIYEVDMTGWMFPSTK